MSSYPVLYPIACPTPTPELRPGALLQQTDDAARHAMAGADNARAALVAALTRGGDMQAVVHAQGLEPRSIA